MKKGIGQVWIVFAVTLGSSLNVFAGTLDEVLAKNNTINIEHEIEFTNQGTVYSTYCKIHLYGFFSQCTASVKKEAPFDALVAAVKAIDSEFNPDEEITNDLHEALNEKISAGFYLNFERNENSVRVVWGENHCEHGGYEGIGGSAIEALKIALGLLPGANSTF